MYYFISLVGPRELRGKLPNEIKKHKKLKYVNNEYELRIQDRRRMVCYNIPVSDIVVTSDSLNRLSNNCDGPIYCELWTDETLYNVSTWIQWIGHECRVSEHCTHFFFRRLSQYCHRVGCVHSMLRFILYVFRVRYARKYFEKYSFFVSLNHGSG